MSFDGSFNFFESSLIRVMEALHKLDLAIQLLGDRDFFFCFFLRNLSAHQDRNYWLLIREIPKFQA
jgi:hypothetical protein